MRIRRKQRLKRFLRGGSCNRRCGISGSFRVANHGGLCSGRGHGDGMESGMGMKWGVCSVE